LKIVAIDDLGGLGSKEGTGVAYAWAPPSIIPLLVPWLGVLLLLLLKANRSPSAWLIWLPLGAGLMIPRALRAALDFIPSEVLEGIAGAVGASAFGLAAVWLTGHACGGRHRFLAFLGMLGVLAGAGCVVVGFRQVSGGGWEQGVTSAVLVGLYALAVPAALSLGGLCCRRRYRPVTLFLWLTFWLLTIWILLATPFIILAIVSAGGDAPWGAFLATILIAAAICLGTLTPFLILSFANAFYRRRLQALLRLEGNVDAG